MFSTFFPTADPGVMSSILALSHTFMEIDREIISTVVLLLLIMKLEGGE